MCRSSASLAIKVPPPTEGYALWPRSPRLSTPSKTTTPSKPCLRGSSHNRRASPTPAQRAADMRRRALFRFVQLRIAPEEPVLVEGNSPVGSEIRGDTRATGNPLCQGEEERNGVSE